MLVCKIPKTPGHRVATHCTSETLRGLLPNGWYEDTHGPLLVRELHWGAGNVPEPDVAVIRGATEDYSDNHPTADAVALEVSDTSPD